MVLFISEYEDKGSGDIISIHKSYDEVFPMFQYESDGGIICS